MFCPNYKIKEVKDGFNEIVTALGGEPLTDEEFRSSELRNKRTGVNYSAMESAYKCYHRNGGNMLDLTPNGKHSVLFDTLLDYFKGDRASAIAAKSNVYSDEFFKWFGDWTGNYEFPIESAKQAILDTFNEGDAYVEELNALRKIVEEDGENLTFDQARSIFDAIRRIAVRDGSVPSTSNSDKIKILEEAFGDNINEKTYFAVDSKEDVQFDLPSDEADAKIEIYNLRKQHPELNLKLESFKNIDKKYFDLLDEFISLVKQSDFFQNIYDLINYSKKATNEQQSFKNVSKVVDENGEPLVVWHSQDEKEFKNRKANWFSTKKQRYYGDNVFAVYLNIKNIYKKETPTLQERALVTDYGSGNEYDKLSDEYDGAMVYHSVFGYYEIVTTKNSNQIKHIENLGTFNPNDPNIYHISAEPKTAEYRAQSVILNEFFDFSTLNSLNYGESVSINSIVKHLLDNEVFASYNNSLAEVILKHNIPVVFSKLPKGRPMDTVESEDTIIIEIDPEQITYYSQEDAAEYVLHEAVHALSIKALRNPQTAEDIEFSTATKRLYNMFDKLMPESQWSRANMDSGAYILSDVYEFAAVFATDNNSKMLLYQQAVEQDKKGNNKLFLRLKRFINALSRLLVNKNVFKGINQDELALYEKNINKFLVSRKPNVQDIDIIEEFNKNLKALTPGSLNNSRIAILRERLARQEGNFIRHYVTTDSEYDATNNEHLWQSRIRVAEALETRLAAINSSTIDDDVKYNAKQVVETQLEQFKNKNLSTVVVLSSFIQQTLPQLLDDVDAVRNMNESDHSFYMYHMHDNFGAYAAIFNQLDRDLKDDAYKRELSSEFESITQIDKLSATKDVDDMLSIINDAAGTARDGVNYMYNILMNNMRRDLLQLGEEVNFSSTRAMLDSLSTIGFDTNSFINILGSKDGAEDPVIRSIVYLVNKALRKSKEETVDVATKLLKLNDQLRPGESALDLYEIDENGFTTQYLVRELNFGKFYNNYRNFIESLNKKFDLPEGNRKAPVDLDKRKQWNIEKNKWLAKNAERRFKPEYYEAYAELSDDTLAQLNSIRGAISQLKQKAYDESDGYYHYDKLTPEEWRRLQGLYIEKRLLGSDYTLYGDLKIPGTDAYRFAKEIQALNEKLYKDPKQINRATDAWQKARKEFINQSVAKHTVDGQTDMFKVNMDVKSWDERNSKRVFKKDGDKLAVFKLIEEKVEEIVGFSKPVYEHNNDGGALYEENRKRINAMIDIFRDYNTGEPNLDIMPARLRSNVQQLEIENTKIKKAAIAGNPELRKKAKKWNIAYRKVFNNYLQSVYTSYYRKRMKSNDDFGDIYIDDGLDDKIIKPRWATKLVVKNKVTDEGESFIEMFTELLPGDGWINSDENNNLLNPNYDSSLNVPYIPKKQLADGSKPYDNSSQFNRIMNSPTLKALYYGVLESMQSANSKFYNRLYQDDYLLPGITGSMWKYAKGHDISGSVSQAWRYTKDHLGFTEQGIRQDTEFGSSIENALASVTDLDEFIKSESSFGGKATGVRPDGRQFNIIPQYYTRKLDDTSQLSSDLIGIVCEYYENACNFENKSEIKDFVESMVDVIENRRYEILNKKTGNKEVKQGSSTKTFEGAKKFVEMNLYNIRSSSAQIGSLNLGKVAQNFSRLTQALNLGMSPAVALTGFFTAQYSHLINAIVGDRGYSMNEWYQATGEVIGHYIKEYGGVGFASNQLSNDKVMLLAEYFDVANQMRRKFKNANRSRIIRFLDNWCFGGLTAVDFASKSTIMTTILMAHRYMDGKFLSKEDVLNKLAASSKEGRNALLEQWKKGETLYSAFFVKDGKIEIKPEYKEAFESVKNTVYHRINKTAESADGMATETQKAAMTTNFFGAAVLTHRQYLPLMIQQRFLPQVWDFDMQMYIQGQYIVDYQFLKNVVWGTIKDGFKISTFKELYDNFTHDTSSEEAWKLSRARSKALKKTAVEIAVFHAFVVPLVSLICMFADDDDQKDNLALQLAAYIARRTQWETFTPYRFDDMLNNIKSVSAQTGTLDKFDALRNTLERRIFPQGSLFDTLLGISSKKPLSDMIERGVYKGHSRNYKTLMQMTPYHNLYEQWYGSKAKRAYYEKQIMKIED